MSSEYKGQTPNHRRPTSELWGDQWAVQDENTQSYPAIQTPATVPFAPTADQQQRNAPPPRQPSQPQQPQNDLQQFSYREHVTGSLSAYPPAAVPSYPAYQPPGYPPTPQHPQSYSPYPPYQGYQSGQHYQGYVPGYPPGYAPNYPYGAYPGYNGYAPPYGWQPVKEPSDGYRLTVIISALVGASLAVIGGLASIVLMGLVIVGASINPNGRVVSDSQYFTSILTFTAFAVSGIVGGGFSLYHGIRGLLRKPSANFALPWFWIFLVLYLLVLGIGYALQVNGQAVTSLGLTALLISLAAIFPALTLLALGVRRLRFPTWTTTWRRFTLALTSGATLGIGIALVLELVLLFLLVRSQNVTNYQQCFDNPAAPNCGSFTTFNVIFIIVALMGPLVEETVKPLGVALFIGKVRSAAEAFTLGLAAGIGFAVVETMGYIGSGYQDWLTVALERTGASLLHGFGTAMVALGWYYLTHAKKQRFLKAIGCWAYAVFQHMVWNGTAVIALLPGPVGTTLNNWNLNLGFTSLPFTEVLNIIEAILILVFFLYITGKLRKQQPSAPEGERREQPSPEPQAVGRM